MRDAMCLVPRAPDPAISALARRTLGFAPTVLDYLGPCPWLAHGEIAFHAARPIHLSSRLCELVPYAVAVDRRASHLVGSLAAFLRLAGYAREELAAIEAGPPLRGFATAEVAALEHAIEIAQGHGSDSLGVLAGAGYSAAARTELTALAALVVFGASVADSLAVPADRIEAFERSLLAKLLRPLIRRRIQALRGKHARPDPIGTAGTLFPRIINALAGTPLQKLARDVLEAAWQSPILPAHEKALAIATVFDTLGTTTMADEVRMLHAHEARSDRERALRDYARVAALQRCDASHVAARLLVRSLRTDELIEAVGIVALAAAMGRIAIVLDVPQAMSAHG